MENDDKRLAAYKALIRFVHWKCWRSCVPDHWALDREDLEAECLMALAKCIDKYLDDKPFDEFLIIARRAITNAILDARAKIYGTSRRMELTNLSLDYVAHVEDAWEETLADCIPGGVEPDAVYESAECMAEILTQLDSDETQVFNALLGGEPRMDGVLNAVRLRRSSVFMDPNITITPHMISVATTVDDAKVNIALSRLAELLEVH